MKTMLDYYCQQQEDKLVTEKQDEDGAMTFIL